MTKFKGERREMKSKQIQFLKYWRRIWISEPCLACGVQGIAYSLTLALLQQYEHLSVLLPQFASLHPPGQREGHRPATKTSPGPVGSSISLWQATMSPLGYSGQILGYQHCASFLFQASGSRLQVVLLKKIIPFRNIFAVPGRRKRWVSQLEEYLASKSHGYPVLGF